MCSLDDGCGVLKIMASPFAIEISPLVAGLEIFGWVALWRPAELLLYDWAPAYRRRRLMRRQSEATIECPADRPATSCLSTEQIHSREPTSIVANSANLHQKFYL